MILEYLGMCSVRDVKLQFLYSVGYISVTFEGVDVN